MSILTKALLGTGAAAAALVATTTPALARHRGGIDVGDVIAGAVILGGIAAVASAIGDGDRDRTYGYPYDGGSDRYGYGGDPRGAVEQCVRAAENTASRYSYGGADVTQVHDIDRNRRGYTVRGRIAVNGDGGDWRRDRYYTRGGYDSGSFRCRVEYGRIVDLDFDGIRGL
jgi:hypothetical protein